jgi:putative two-component system response regulator
MLHDIGKIGIPDEILQKPGPLTPQEFDVIKNHPQIGKRILEGVAIFRAYLPIVELHHENPDGTGYPFGLRGDAIPLGARIVHVVDAFDAMTSNRTYRRAMSSARAQEVLRRFAGTQFDAAIVEVFLRLLGANLVGPPETETSEQLVALHDQLAEQLVEVEVVH